MTFQQAIAELTPVRMRSWPAGKFVERFESHGVYDADTGVMTKPDEINVVFVVTEPNVENRTYAVADMPQDWLQGNDWEVFDTSTLSASLTGWHYLRPQWG